MTPATTTLLAMPVIQDQSVVQVSQDVTVQLGSPDDQMASVYRPEPATVTDASGFYGFEDLASGDYCVVVDKSTIPADFCIANGIDLGDPQFTCRMQVAMLLIAT